MIGEWWNSASEGQCVDYFRIDNRYIAIWDFNGKAAGSHAMVSGDVVQGG
jgi:hypothetical protein